MPFSPSFVNGFVQISAVKVQRSLRIDGAGFYQLACREYSFSARKIVI
ncbi:DUF2575 family protein [Kosakonia sacchari]|nr:DUF2575 family protein [Kosakonia sacchari]